jgi:hypothetical protein
MSFATCSNHQATTEGNTMKVTVTKQPMDINTHGQVNSITTLDVSRGGVANGARPYVPNGIVTIDHTRETRADKTGAK